MPQIDSDILPIYAAQGVEAFAIHTSRDTQFAQEIALDKGLTFPTAVDVESEVFRYYRVPGKVFPLHIVIDREGKIAHVDNESDLTAVEAVLADLVGM